MSDDPSTLRWPEYFKDPDDVAPMILGLFGLCAAFWAPNEEYATGDFAWPNITVVAGKIVKGATGLVMECTQPGRSATKEPRWGIAADVVMPALDGSVQWTPRVGADQGIEAIATASVKSIVFNDTQQPATDLVVSQILVSESTKLLFDYSGGTLGESYEVEFNFMIGGRPRVGRQIVSIAKK